MSNKSFDEWEVISIYSRKEALADGFQVLANPDTTKEAGIKYPVFFTRTAYDKYVKVPEGYEGLQDEDARLWDIFTMFKYYSRNATSSVITFKVSVTLPDNGDWTPQNEKREGSTQRLVTLLAEIGPQDFDDPSPAITIMIPGED